MEDTAKKCGCPCHRMAGLLIVLLGLLFLLNTLGMVSSHIVNVVWPVLVILIGVKKMTKGLCKCCSKDRCCR